MTTIFPALLRGSSVRLALALMVLLLLCQHGRADGHRNVHYYTGWGTVRWDLLTHLVYFDTSVIDAHGAFIPHSQQEKNKIAQLQAQADAHGKVLMVGYGGSFSFDGPFRAMLENPAKRAAFIAGVHNAVTTLNLTGVDMDWEYPSNNYEFSLMDTFYTELRAKLGPEPLISAAVGAWQVQLAAATVNESLDWIQTMGYYWNSNSQSATDLARWTNAGVAHGKINLGVPFAGKSRNATVSWDVPYYELVDSISPFDPNVNDVYSSRYQGWFNFVGVNLQKAKVRTAAAGGNGTMVWHHATDVWDPSRSLAVSLHDETVRHVAVIDSFELPVGESANHLYASGSPAIKGSYTRVAGHTGGEVAFSLSGAQWSSSSLISHSHPSGYAFPDDARIRFDYKVINTQNGVSLYLRIFDGSGHWIQKGVWNALSSTGWKRASFARNEFSSNPNFDQTDVRRYQILAQADWTRPAFTANVVLDNLVMIAPAPAHRPVEDRDADGCSDWLEKRLGTSPVDATSSPASPFTGLHAWWKFDNNFGHLAREQNQEVHGKVWGASWTSGVSGPALQFDGVNDKITVDTPAAISGTGPFSLSLWVKTTDADGGMILQQRDSSTDGYKGQYRLRCNPDGTVQFSVHNNGFQFNFASSTAVNDGRWHHIAAVRDGSEGSIFIDGQLDAQASGPIKALAGLEVAVGYDLRDNVNYFQGTVDDIRIYARAIHGAIITDTDADSLADHWEIGQFGNLTTGAGADPDDDHFSLFEEMVFGGSATAAESLADFTACSLVDADGTVYYEYRYRRPRNHAQLGIAYQVQSSATMAPGSWQEAAPVSLTTENHPDNTTEWVVCRFPVQAGTPAMFFHTRAFLTGQ